MVNVGLRQRVVRVLLDIGGNVGVGTTVERDVPEAINNHAIHQIHCL